MMKTLLLSLADAIGGPILALDTSSTQASLALIDPVRRAVNEHALQARALPSEAVVARLDTMLKEAHCDAKTLRAIVVGLGPGSFTGLRVGLATAKGLAFGSGAKVYGISSMEVLARAAGVTGPVLVVGDARRGGLYSALYDVAAHHAVHVVLAEQVMTLAALTRAVQHALGEDAPQALAELTVVGDMGAEVAQALGARFVQAPMRIAHGILAAHDNMMAGRADDLSALMPRYLRTSSVGL